jgi:hypothetical protein
MIQNFGIAATHAKHGVLQTRSRTSESIWDGPAMLSYWVDLVQTNGMIREPQ